MTVELKFLGKRLKGYNGVDGTTPINLKAGDIVGVSEAKAKRLLEDFPHDFISNSGPREAEPEPKEASPALKRELKEPPPVEPTGKVPAKNKAMTPKKNKRK